MKDRIRQVMESLHMTQQEFAEKTQIGAATLSNIFNDRTRPTLNVVELIKKNIPNISTDWLLLGVGSMYVDDHVPEHTQGELPTEVINPSLPFDGFSSPTPQYAAAQQVQSYSGSKVVPNKTTDVFSVMQEKPQRKVTEIRVYYDDQTWESFSPSKSK